MTAESGERLRDGRRIGNLESGLSKVRETSRQKRVRGNTEDRESSWKDTAGTLTLNKRTEDLEPLTS